MDISEMTVEQFQNLPLRNWGKRIEFTSMVILPDMRDNLHDSGFRCMDFVAVDVNEPICRLSGCSDVIHIDGIGGYGQNWLEEYGKVPDLIVPSGWSIDCLPQSGLLRIWPASGKMACGDALSSFEIFTVY